VEELLTPGWIGIGREPTLVVLIGAVVALFVVTLAFSAYAIILRIQNDRRDARRMALAETWQGALLDAIADPEKVRDLHRLVDHDRGLHFIGFVLKFARRMRGGEVEILKSVVGPYMGQIVARLASDRVEERARAVQTLGTLGLPEHEGLVLAALNDPSPLVAMVAARALAKEEDPRYAAPILAKLPLFSEWNRLYLASMLAAMGPEVSPELRDRLADVSAEPWTRSVMAQALRLQSDFRAGDVAAGVVLSSDHRDLIVDCLRLLAEVGRPEHLAAVRARTRSHEPAVRAQALRALGRLGGPDDLPALVEGLDDDFAWAALYAARGLREAGGGELLLQAAGTGDRRGRLAAQVLAEEGVA
jgi:HEAT repeat protein